MLQRVFAAVIPSSVQAHGARNWMPPGGNERVAHDVLNPRPLRLLKARMLALQTISLVLMWSSPGASSVDTCMKWAAGLTLVRTIIFSSLDRSPQTFPPAAPIDASFYLCNKADVGFPLIQLTFVQRYVFPSFY